MFAYVIIKCALLLATLLDLDGATKIYQMK